MLFYVFMNHFLFSNFSLVGQDDCKLLFNKMKMNHYLFKLEKNPVLIQHPVYQSITLGEQNNNKMYHSF